MTTSLNQIEAQHTPGPWTSYANNHGGYYVKPTDSYLNMPIAAASPGDNADANARLTAALTPTRAAWRTAAINPMNTTEQRTAESGPFHRVAGSNFIMDSATKTIICACTDGDTDRVLELMNTQSREQVLIEALKECDAICTESPSVFRKRMGTRLGNVIATVRSVLSRPPTEHNERKE